MPKSERDQESKWSHIPTSVSFSYTHTYFKHSKMKMKKKKINKKTQPTEQNNSNQTKNMTLSPLKYVEKWIGPRIQMASYSH